MSIYFDFKTINELMGDNYYRQVKKDTSKFTPDDWIRYIAPLVNYSLGETTKGMNTERSYQKFILLGVLVGLGKTPQEAISQVQEWQNTGASQLLKSGTTMGTSGNIGAQGSTGTSGGTMPTNRQISQDKSKFTPDDWIRYIAPLVIYALKETTQGMNIQRAYDKFILLGVLVGLGKTPQEAINQVQEWQNTGASQLLKSGTSTGTSGGIGSGSTGTSGNIGTGVTGGSGGMGTKGSTGGGGMGTQGNTGTSGSTTIPTNTQVKQDTSKFTPDDWIRYITPLVTYSLRETTQGMNTENAYQKFILLGVLVGLGKTPQEAINQVQEWQNTGASQLLKSGTSTETSGVTRIERSTVLPPHLTTFKFASGGIDIGGSTRTSDNTNKSNRLYFD